MRFRAVLLTLAMATLGALVPVTEVAAIDSTTPVALHSLKGSKRTIFLDFDGNTVLEKSWSTTALGMAAKAYPGLNLQGSSATFSDAEQEFVRQVWRRVAELYAPFDVNVTTVDPGSAAISRSSLTDDVYGVQLAITSDPNLDEIACGPRSTCSGAAPTGTFDQVETSQSEYQPAWVFAANTYPSRTDLSTATMTAAAAAHEAGHTFGLNHDGSLTSLTNYAGHGHWFPVMGRSTNKPLVQWSRGEYAGATSVEDDLAIIAAGGAPRRTDDYPNDGATPFNLGAPATSGRNAFTRRGVISTDADNDVFTFNRRCAGPMLVEATGIGQGTSLDLKLTVSDSAGRVIATSNPTSGQAQHGTDLVPRVTGMDASASFAKAARGSYRVRVEGVGSGNPRSTGYSGYGSLGQYTLTVTRCSTPLRGVTTPGAPVIGTATTGFAGKPVTAVARWSPPGNDGGAAVTRYQLQAARVDSRGAVTRTTSYSLGADVHGITVTLPAGRYKFRVAATNRVGTGRYSAYSSIVTAR